MKKKTMKFIDLNGGGEMTEVSRSLHTRTAMIGTGIKGGDYVFKHRGETSGVIEIYETSDSCDAGQGCDEPEPQGQGQCQLPAEA